MKKFFALILGFCFSLLAFSACGGEGNGKKLKISEVTHSVFYAPMYLADALGYFKDEGFDVELTNAGGADAVMASVLSGDADIGFCGPEAALYVLIGGSNDVPEVFAQLTKRDGSFLVSRKDEPQFSWSSLKDKEILAGRRGGVPAMTFEYILNGENLYDGKDVTLNFDVAFNLMTSAFEAGTADYCTMFEPTASEYQATGKGYVVASVGEKSGEIPYTCYMAKRSWLKKHADKADGLCRALIKAIKYLEETPSETVAPLLLPYFAGTPVDSLKISLDSYKKIDAWAKDLCMTEAGFNKLQDVIENAGELARRVSFSELVDTVRAKAAYNAVYGLT